MLPLQVALLFRRKLMETLRQPVRVVSGLGAASAVPGAVRAGERRNRPYLPPQLALARVTSSPQFARMPRAQQAALLAATRRHHLLAQLPEAMLEVLAAAREVRRERLFRRPRTTADRPAELRLQAAAAPACEEAMRRSRRDLRPYATITVECWKRGRGQAPLLNGSLDSAGGALALSLPVSWLNRVWVRGLALVDGHFVLKVDRPAPAGELEATVIRWERRLAGRSTASAVSCQLRRTGDGWTLWW